MKGKNIMGTKQHSSLAEYFLDIACQKLPVVKRAIAESGDVSLSDYVRNLVLKKANCGYQDRDDLLEVVKQYAASLLGESVGKKVADDLAEFPVVLTANHHGVDYFSQSVQGSLIFALNTLSGSAHAETVPVFSCGNVPLNNVTYPRGLLLYHSNPKDLDNIPLKLPIFPKQFKTQTASLVPAYNQKMIRNAGSRLEKMAHEGQISYDFVLCLQKIFCEDYCSPSVMSLPTYSQQSVVLNNRIWKRLFSESDGVPEMVYLEQEKIVASLLESDLTNPQSLARRVMFDPVLREQVLTESEGVKGCWKRKALIQRLCRNAQSEVLKEEAAESDGCGTVFFWGIDHKGRKIPLCLETDTSNKERLRGVDDSGRCREIPYTPEAIIEGLREGTLLPSGFTCFLVLSFARGLVCVGAYFQAEYLPLIQKGLVTALKKTGYRDIACFVEKVTADSYLSGMLALMSRTENNHLLPAGPAEIIAGGGISSQDIQQILSLTVREAHLAALFETVPAAVPSEYRISGWKKQLAADCFHLLEGKIPVK